MSHVFREWLFSFSNIQVGAPLAEVNSMYYNALFMFDCFVLRLNKFVPQGHWVQKGPGMECLLKIPEGLFNVAFFCLFLSFCSGSF